MFDDEENDLKFSADSKKFYLPKGMYSICPICNQKIYYNYYISYPTFNTKQHISFSHEVMDDETNKWIDHEWIEEFVLKLEFIQPKIKDMKKDDEKRFGLDCD